MINIEDYREKIVFYRNANHALEDFIALSVKKETGGARVIHKNAAIKRMAAVPVFTLLFIGAVTFYVFFHVWPRILLIEVLAAIAVAFRKTTKFFTSERYLRQKVQAQPDEEINEILTGEMGHFWRMEVVWSVYGILLACALLLMLNVFRSPHMVFIKSNDGYVLFNYTLSRQPDSDVVIPDTWKGEPVTGIRSGTFYEMSSIKSIKLPKGIKRICRNTFEQCECIQKIKIPEGVTEVDEYAFQDCRELKSVIFPSTVKSIESSAFIGCRKLKAITVPRGCKIDVDVLKEMDITVRYYR